MVYALNVFNLIPSQKKNYKKYSIEAGKIIYSKGSKVIASGWNPIRNLHREIQRDYAVIVKFPSEKFFQECLDEAEKKDIRSLRENSTKDYIWTLYEN